MGGGWGAVFVYFPIFVVKIFQTGYLPVLKYFRPLFIKSVSHVLTVLCNFEVCVFWGWGGGRVYELTTVLLLSALVVLMLAVT